jgi:hypothetical protein
MDNRPIQSLWVGETLSTIERLSISSFLKNGHEFHLYTYGKVNNVPEGTLIIDAREICELDDKIMTKTGFGKGSYAPFADYFRMQLMAQKGNWWVDLDVVCLKSFSGLPETAIATSLEIPEGDCANSNVLAFPKGHWFPKECLRYWEQYDRDSIYHGLGPDTVKKVVAENKAYDFLVPHDVFNPISWRHVCYLLEKPEPVWSMAGIKRNLNLAEKVGKITNNSRAIHLWNEGWRSGGYDKNGTYNKDSIFESLKRRYL